MPKTKSVSGRHHRLRKLPCVHRSKIMDAKPPRNPGPKGYATITLAEAKRIGIPRTN